MVKTIEKDKTIERIKNILQENKISIYGTADVKLLENERPGNRPTDILPGAKSFLCIAAPFPRGIYNSKKNMEISYWWNSNLYFDMIDELMLRVCATIEKEGYEALPINGCFPVEINYKLEFLGYVNMIKMAEAVKIGKIGKNGLIFHSQHGPRLILGAIVTNAPLPEITVPGPDEKGCPEGCRVCQEQCPASAIDENGKVDQVACLKHAAEAPINLYPLFRTLFSILAKLKMVNPEKLFPRKVQRKLNIAGANNHAMFACINCISMCPYTVKSPGSVEG